MPDANTNVKFGRNGWVAADRLKVDDNKLFCSHFSKGNGRIIFQAYVTILCPSLEPCTVTFIVEQRLRIMKIKQISIISAFEI